jgi:methionyl-tRNA formyltransferase
MKIIIFGCQKIAIDCIDYLSTLNNIEISLVYTYDLPLDTTYGYKSVIEKCKELNILCKKPLKIDKFVINEIENINPDFIFSIYYRKIFPKSIFKISKNIPINMHPSLLPNYRGPVPTAWTIRNGEKETGFTIHQMDEGIDTGDILIQKRIKIGDDETGFELYEKCMTIGAELFINNFEKIINKSLKPKKQVGIGSYYGKLKGKHTIDWQNSVKYIKDMIRVHAAPFNTAESTLYNHYFFINKVSIINNPNYVLQGPGRIIDIVEGHPIVSCADGFLKLEKFDIYPHLSKKEKNVYMKIGNKFN